MHLDARKKAGIGLAACILAMAAALVYLFSAACDSGRAPAPTAPRSQPQTLRETLTREQSLVAGLLDSQTPFPATAGKAILLVDGDFYAGAEAAVTDYVREQAESGIPIGVFGDQAGFDALCLAIGAPRDLPATPQAGDSAGDEPAPGSFRPETAVRGLRLHPGRNPDGRPRAAAIDIAGWHDDLAPLIEAIIDWAEADER